MPTLIPSEENVAKELIYQLRVVQYGFLFFFFFFFFFYSTHFSYHLCANVE